MNDVDSLMPSSEYWEMSEEIMAIVKKYINCESNCKPKKAKELTSFMPSTKCSVCMKIARTLGAKTNCPINRREII